MPENNGVNENSINVDNANVEVKSVENVSETPGVEEKKESKSLIYNNREVNLKYVMRAICVIDEVYKIIEHAIDEGINEYKLMYAYDEQLYTMGYEKKDKYIFAVWCPDGSIRTFDSLEDVKHKVTLGHSVTIIREFLTGPNGSAVEVPLESNFMLKPFLVHNNNKDYNLNMSDQISEVMQRLADSKVERLDNNGKSTLIIMAIIFAVLLIFVFFIIK